MKVIKLCADGVCSIKNIENTLEALQHEVGGYIETLTLTSDLVLIIDEEGCLKFASVPEGYKLNPKYIEKRTKRIQLVVQPSLYDKLKAAADAAGLSLNEYANQAFKDKLGRAGIEVKEANPVE